MKTETFCKPKLSVWQLICMSVGFFGIQHGFSIQFARMSSIYEKLGASPDEIPFLWLAAPLTGLIIQPIIGYMSDRTWGKLGRRRPYFLTGAVLATIALFVMPNSSSLWMAAGMLWILDASINISMEPFRAFVADKLPQEQVATGYAFQTVMIGLGGALGFWISSYFVSLNVQFYLCGLIYLAAVLFTVITSKEYPPDNIEEFNKQNAQSKGTLNFVKELFHNIVKMPAPMKRLAWVQFFSWMGLFCFWIFYSVAIAHHVFGATDPTSKLYEQGIKEASSSMSMYQMVSMVFALLIPLLSIKMSRVWIHTIGLTCAGIGLLSIWIIKDPIYLYLSNVGIGIGWATILSMPYAILVNYVPKEKYGIYMGIFNMFIVIPEIISSLVLGWVMKNFLNNNHASAVVLGGFFMLIAAVIVQTLRKYDTKVTCG